MSLIKRSPAGLSGTQTLLVAAARLGPEFTEAELVAGAWEENPAAFGLKGFAGQYPASHEVRFRLMGKRGLVGRLWLERVGRDRYRLTGPGRVEADRLAAGGKGRGPAANPADLPCLTRTKVPQTMVVIDRLVAGERVPAADLADLALVHRFLGEQFARRMGGQKREAR